MRSFLLINILIPFYLLGTVEYEVYFEGNITHEVVSVLESVSQSVLLEKDPPSTRIALKRRAEADLPNLIHGLHSLGYYNAKVDLDIEFDLGEVIFTIDLGPVYPLVEFNIELAPGHYIESLIDRLKLEYLGVVLGRPALPKKILDGEANLLVWLAEEGYPLAFIVDRKIQADQADKVIRVNIVVNPGLKVVFGPTKIVGLKTIYPSFIEKRIAWNKGGEYNPYLIAKTQYALESSGLFSSISIQQLDEVVKENQLPFEIQVSEANHRTIGFGVSYNTQLGPGALVNWEHRNMRGRGEKLRFKGEVWRIKQQGIFEYILPDFFTQGQELKWVAEVEKEKTEGFSEVFFKLSGILERRITDKLKFSFGLSYKHLFSSNSDNNRAFSLMKLPIQVKWNHVDRALDPSCGATLNLKLVPTLQLMNTQFGYVINHTMVTGYYPLNEDKLILAFRGQIGTITGSERYTIPPPERFYAGSESTLRGYKYMTVSPLDDENKPIGGRSLMVYSLETRIKLKQCLGWVFFYEIGNVYSKPVPQFHDKQLQSIGTGFRYHTPVGPLRADIAFPLNKRPGVDRAFQVYLSIGQAF
ncbi:BamA/TamA family outer membrane protein [Chlamydiales bacterium]|nr:BamA/TamA family outer membrane protein [Chlamydiales bacterium]